MNENVGIDELTRYLDNLQNYVAKNLDVNESDYSYSSPMFSFRTCCIFKTVLECTIDLYNACCTDEGIDNVGQIDIEYYIKQLRELNGTFNCKSNPNPNSSNSGILLNKHVYTKSIESLCQFWLGALLYYKTNTVSKNAQEHNIAPNITQLLLNSLKLSPNNSACFSFLGCYYLFIQRDSDRALKCFEKAVNLDLC